MLRDKVAAASRTGARQQHVFGHRLGTASALAARDRGRHGRRWPQHWRQQRPCKIRQSYRR